MEKIQPILQFYKKVEKNKNRIIIPKCMIEKYGREYLIEIMSDDSIRLTPVKRG